RCNARLRIFFLNQPELAFAFSPWSPMIPANLRERLMSIARVLLWTDTPGAYLDAIAAADLTSRVAVEALSRKDRPNQAQQAETDAMLAWGAPPGLLPHMTKLRWIQALTAGVEGWLALPDLPGSVALTCARGTHRESMAENILGALFHLTKSY